MGKKKAFHLLTANVSKDFFWTSYFAINTSHTRVINGSRPRTRIPVEVETCLSPSNFHPHRLQPRRKSSGKSGTAWFMILADSARSLFASRIPRRPWSVADEEISWRFVSTTKGKPRTLTVGSSPVRCLIGWAERKKYRRGGPTQAYSVLREDLPWSDSQGQSDVKRPLRIASHSLRI